MCGNVRTALRWAPRDSTVGRSERIHCATRGTRLYKEDYSAHGYTHGHASYLRHADVPADAVDVLPMHMCLPVPRAHVGTARWVPFNRVDTVSYCLPIDEKDVIPLGRVVVFYLPADSICQHTQIVSASRLDIQIVSASILD